MISSFHPSLWTLVSLETDLAERWLDGRADAGGVTTVCYTERSMWSMEWDETANRTLRRAGRPLRVHVLGRKKCQARAGPKSAIFDLSMPSQIRWAVSQTTKVRHRPILVCPALSMVGLFSLPQTCACLSHVAFHSQLTFHWLDAQLFDFVFVEPSAAIL